MAGVNIMAHLERVIVLIDMDCFYCQVEENLDPNLKGKPIAVVQYNQWRGGGIIAVNYPARERGVTRHMRGEDAKEKCPEIVLVKVPQIRGKADLSKYRDAGKNVADVLQTFTNLLERASVDEAYLDITNIVLERMKDGIDQITTENLMQTYVVGCNIKDFLYSLKNEMEYSESNFKLCIGGIITEEIRAEVYKQTGYQCSAGIAHNKILAKLVCSLNKPNKQTILPHTAIPEYFETLPLRKVKSLGGKFGQSLSENLGISTMGELVKFSERQLTEKFGKKNGLWLYNIARGIDFDSVVTRLISKSIGCCKKFPGRTALLTCESVQHWINELAAEIAERLLKDLEENNRKAKHMIISFAQEINNKNISSSRTHPLTNYEQAQIGKDAFNVVKKSCHKSDGSYSVTFLGISVSNFQEEKKTKDIASFFKKSNISIPKIYNEETQKLEEEKRSTSSDCEMSTESLNANEEDDDYDNHSTYSASTDDLEEDPKSYIYFEDIYPEFVSSQPIESYQLANKDNFLNVKKTEEKDDSEIRKNASQSFFSRYFESIAENNKTPDVEISKSEETYLENNNKTVCPTENDKEETNKNEKSYGIKRKVFENNILQYFPKCEEPNENYCSDCKKNIPVEDLFDHTDYHIAKKLQADLNKSEISRTPTINKGIINVKPKIKKPIASISNYFKPL